MPYGLINADVMQTSTTNGVIGAKNASTLQNRLIDAGFTINQRGYVSGTSLSSGTYAHDRWKAGSGGCTYTFTQLSTGVPIVITITAGSLQQVIEGCNMPEGGTYVLSWTGTAQARFNGGTYGSSPLAVTGITAGANTTIEFNTGTCSFPQLEVGSSATGYEYRQYGQELQLCQRYYYKAITGTLFNQLAFCNIRTTTSHYAFLQLPVTLRANPSSVDYSGLGIIASWGAGVTGLSSLSLANATYGAGQTQVLLDAVTSGAVGTVGQVSMLLGNNSATSFVALNAEL